MCVHSLPSVYRPLGIFNMLLCYERLLSSLSPIVINAPWLLVDLCLSPILISAPWLLVDLCLSPILISASSLLVDS